MLFNSLDFAIFLPIVFILYWFVTHKSLPLQNSLIVISSYVFYGWWDWRFLSLIVFSTVVDYTIGILLSKEENALKRKILLWLSIIVNLGFLGFFKYYNFFLDNFTTAFSFFGMAINANSLNIILPVGISFYTFQTMSYTIDVYKKKLSPTRDFIAFSAFVSFFPQLVAGPIERATNLLPQFFKKRKFEYLKATDGIRQVLWGFFKKVVIADNCAPFVNTVYQDFELYSSPALILAAILFAFQIYCDFSGYSDIAIGTARLFGFDLMQNFKFPYFSRDIAEFWRRWHISLSTWFRDYLYIPLGGSAGSKWNKIKNTFIIFIVSGFWHGSNWTFIAWGFLNALYFLPLLVLNKNRVHLDTVSSIAILPSIKETLQILFTFSITVVAWIFFRSENLTDAFSFIINIFQFENSKLSIASYTNIDLNICLFSLSIFILTEWIGRKNKYAIQNFYFMNSLLNFILIISFLTCIYLLGNFNSEYDFIYFQF